MALFHETHENIHNFSKFSKPPCYELDKSFPIYKKLFLSFQMKNLARKLTAAKNVSSDAIDGNRHISAILYLSIMEKLFFEVK